MKQPQIDVNRLFAQNLERLEKEREELIRSRIQSFNERHKTPEGNDGSSIREGRVRPIWSK